MILSVYLQSKSSLKISDVFLSKSYNNNNVNNNDTINCNRNVIKYYLIEIFVRIIIVVNNNNNNNSSSNWFMSIIN